MGEGEIDALKVDFDRELRLEFHGAKVTSDAGLLAYRELDDVFGLTAAGGGLLADARTGTNTQHTMTTLREKLVKIGAKVVRHARHVVFQLAEVAVPKELFAVILGRIARLREAPA